MDWGNQTMQSLIPLINEETIRKRIGELAASISDDFRGKETIIIGVLKGAMVFMADLIRSLDMEFRCDFISLSSYGEGTDSSGRITMEYGPASDIKDKHLLIVDCVADTGLTLHFLVDHLRRENPRVIKTCALLNKEGRRIQPLDLNYIGFNIPDRFVVGYGLDLNERYRGLPYIAYITEGVD